MRRLFGVAFACAIALITTAHVGSPNVVFDGNAGPYPVRVIVRPPDVVPGLAEVIVRVDTPDAQRITATPVFYRAGAAGAPRGDALVRVAGQSGLYSGTLWLMSRGSSSVYVTVSGARGSGTAIVPVAALATARLGLSPALGAILVVLGTVLFAGLVTIVRAANGEALLEPGQPVDEPTRSRARIAGLVAAPVLALLVLGGAKWWGAVDREYQRFMYRAPAVSYSDVERPGERTLWLNIRDTASFQTLIAAPIPDHGKMMHLFLIGKDDHAVFAHLHPTLLSSETSDSLQFRVSVPSIPGGRYRLFGDVVLANGMSFTVSRDVQLGGERAAPAGDPDDSWSSDAPVQLRPGASFVFGNDSLVYTGAAAIAANTPVDLRFEVRGANGVAPVAPYLGMSAHAVILRSDESVFVHLHPMGTVSPDAQRAFASRDSGTAPMSMNMPAQLDGRFAFPYEFPKAGAYRVWVQFRTSGAVHTGTFDVIVR